MSFITKNVGRNVIGLLQEVESWGDTFSVGGWQIFHVTGSYTAIAIPLDLIGHIRTQHFAKPWASMLVVGSIAAISLYMPQGSNYESYFDAWQDVIDLRSKARKLGFKDTIIGEFAERIEMQVNDIW